MQAIDRITWIQPYYDLILNLIPIDTKTILDIGSGNGIFGFILRKTRNAKLTAIEPFTEYDLWHYDYIIRKKWQDCNFNELAQTSELDRPKYNKYDCITALEMIEHLSKEDALDFLQWTKFTANKVIISTPYVFEKQPAYDNNELQKHVCNITIKDFLNEGYRVYLFGTIAIRGIILRFFANKNLEPLLRGIGNIANIIGVYET